MNSENNRELKFMAWIEEEKQFADECVIYYDGSWSASFKKSEGIISGYGEKKGDYIFRCTGMKDVNKKEIYEGHICKYCTNEIGKNGPCKVERKFVITGIESKYKLFCLLSSVGVEIIGHIKTNPELLK